METNSLIIIVLLLIIIVSLVIPFIRQNDILNPQFRSPITIPNRNNTSNSNNTTHSHRHTHD